MWELLVSPAPGRNWCLTNWWQESRYSWTPVLSLPPWPLCSWSYWAFEEFSLWRPIFFQCRKFLLLLLITSPFVLFINCWNWVFCCVFLVNVSQGELFNFQWTSCFCLLSTENTGTHVPHLDHDRFAIWQVLNLHASWFLSAISKPYLFACQCTQPILPPVLPRPLASTSASPPPFLSLVFNYILLFPDCILFYLFYIYIVFRFVFVNLLVLICMWLVK